MTMKQITQFTELHTQASPLILPNVWDASSAALFQRLGAPAVATSSAALAWSLGYADGSTIPRNELLAATARILRVLTIPLTLDLEDGYSENPKDVAYLVSELANMGVVGINLEDGTKPAQMLAQKIESCRQALGNSPLFINARTDVYLRELAKGSEARDLTLVRALMYRSAGANGLFVPGLTSVEDTAYIVERTDMPVNLMLLPNMPTIPELAAAGARRFTAGPANFLSAYGHACASTSALLKTQNADALFMGEVLEYGEMNTLFS